MGFSSGARLEALCARAEAQGMLYEEDDLDVINDVMVTRTTQDCEPIISDNKERLIHTDGYTPSRLLRHVAHIPNVLLVQWHAEGINVHTKEGWERAKRKLRDPIFRDLRTSPGRF